MRSGSKSPASPACARHGSSLTQGVRFSVHDASFGGAFGLRFFGPRSSLYRVMLAW